MSLNRPAERSDKQGESVRIQKHEAGIVLLRLVLGAVVLVQSLIFLFSVNAVRSFERHGLPNGVRLVLGWGEVAGAILFLVPSTIVSGAWLLLAVFVGAIGLHLAHGQFEIGGLFVYGAAVIAVLAHRPAQPAMTE